MAVRITLRPERDPLTTGTHFRIDVGRDIKSVDPAKARYRDRYWADSEQHRDEILARLKDSGERRRIVVTAVPPLSADDGYLFNGKLEYGRHLAPAAARPLSKHILVDVTAADSLRRALDDAAVTAIERGKQRVATRRHAARIARATTKARQASRAGQQRASDAAAEARADDRSGHERQMIDAIQRYRRTNPALAITRCLIALANETQEPLSTWKSRCQAVNSARVAAGQLPLK